MIQLMLASLAVAAGATEDGPVQPEAAAEPSHRASMPLASEPVYPAAFFASFQPQTALDMLERVPGFAISSGSLARGFGGTAGNVLIDGQRPTVKAGGITEVLRRIPASRVERIVLLRGSDTAEAQGQVLVANVILRADAAGSGNATLTLAHTSDGHISPKAAISYAKAIGAWQASIELSGEIVRYPSDAVYRVRDAHGALTGTRIETVSGRSPELGLAASASRDAWGGTLTLNGRLNWDPYLVDQTIGLFAGEASGSPDGVRTIDYDEDKASGELGIDWTRPFAGDWTAKLVGLGRLETYRSDEDYAEPGYRGVSALDQKPLELLARATATRGGTAAFRPELGMEIAYNRLTSNLDYAEDTGVGLVPVSLSNANTRVSELRGEAFANVALRLSSTLELEAGTAFELSRIRVTGDADSEQSLSYLKPSAALVWSPSSSTQLRLGARRTVDQLDFGDFAASVDQADSRPLGGNGGLRPAQTTRLAVRLDHRWGKGGALVVETWHEWRDGLLGYVLLPSGDEALGTVGDARKWGVSAEATLPLDIMLPGARVTLEGGLRDSRFRDPLTGSVRPIDGLAPHYGSLAFRHDIESLRSSWGFSFSNAAETKVHYLGEITVSDSEDSWSAFVQTSALPGIKATLEVSAITGADSYRLRRFYAPNRSGTFAGSEERNREQGASISLTLSRRL